MDYFGQVKAAADAVRARVGDFPSTAIILGSGLGDFASSLGAPTPIPYTELPNWPIPRVAGHMRPWAC
jgi:purine nucleoside phosphorylase